MCIGEAIIPGIYSQHGCSVTCAADAVLAPFLLLFGAAAATAFASIVVFMSLLLLVMVF